MEYIFICQKKNEERKKERKRERKTDRQTDSGGDVQVGCDSYVIIKSLSISIVAIRIT